MHEPKEKSLKSSQHHRSSELTSKFYKLFFKKIPSDKGVKALLVQNVDKEIIVLF